MQSACTVPSTTSSNEAEPAWPRDSDYYMTNVIFLVEGTLFSVPRHYFASYSDIFSSTFSLPPGEGNNHEGTSDKNPFRLDGISKSEFKSILKVMYPLHTPPTRGDISLQKDEWIAALKLATMWNFQDIRARAIDELDVRNQSLGISPIDRILLAKEFKVPSWLAHGYNEMVKRSAVITHEEAARLGLETTVTLGHVREEVARLHLDFAYRRREDQNFMDYVNRAFEEEIDDLVAANRVFNAPRL